MNDDLISRSALKKVITANHYLLSAKNNSIDYGMFTTGILQAIDNAPTVEPQKIVIIPPELIEKLALSVVDIVGNIDWDKAIEAYKARPQGEWVYDNILNNWKCSECGETPKTIGYVGTRLFMEQHFKFCNHCGADMRGGSE